MAEKSVLMILTSHDRVDDEHETGVWFDEFAAPYHLFTEAGYHVTVASTKGGAVPIDPSSLPDSLTAADQQAMDVLAHTFALADFSGSTGDFDAVFFPGGHGTMYDLPENPYVTEVVERFARDDKVIGAVCHGPAALVGPRRADGAPFVSGRRIAAFTNREEAEVGLDRVMPFLLETQLKDIGAQVVDADPWADNVVIDGKLVTGQNPQSSAHAAREIIRILS
jgi:putative intracellular protease/amidase